MRKIFILGAISVITSAFLVGCGSGSADSVTTANTGYFQDSEVEGCEYQTSSGISGTTDQYGRFKFRSGDSVKFHIGKLELGEAVPGSGGFITPDDLTDNNETKVLMLRMLQSLDSDNNTSNGITILDSIKTTLHDLNETKHIEDLNETTLLSLDTTLASKLDKDGDDHLDVNTTEAQEHFNQTKQKIEAGHRPDEQEKSKGNTQGHNEFDLENYLKTTTLSQETKDALAYMGNEERLAYDLYINLYNYHNENSGTQIKQLTNIATRSESKHIGIVQSLVHRYNLTANDVTNVSNPVDGIDESNVTVDDVKQQMGVYDIPAIQNLYDALYAKGKSSPQDALEVGCMVEVTDINDLNEYITYANESNATDVVEAFKVLRNGSYNHYWAFDKGLKNMGVTAGCCSLGTVDGVDYCKTEIEYPKNSNQENDNRQDNKHKQGNGNGYGHGRE